MKRVLKILLTTSAFALLLGGSAVNTMAQSQQPLLGCVKPGTGLLRILQPGETCKNNETPLGFNQLPLLVALEQRVSDLEDQVDMLEREVADLKNCLGSHCSQP